MSEEIRKGTLLLAISIMLLLQSCSNGNQAQTHFQDYRDRLKRVLKIKDVDASDKMVKPIIKKVVIPTLPRKRDRSLPALQTNMSLYEFLKLKNCPLKKRIANKNNQLGQHMQPANGMVYEVLVRSEISECLLLENNPTMKTKLKQLSEYKQKSKLNDFWQYSFGADWYASVTSRSEQAIKWDDDDTLILARQAYSQLNNALLPYLVSQVESNKQENLTKNREAELKRILNDSIQKLENSEALGKLFQSIQSSMYELMVANQLLENAKVATLCNTTVTQSRVAESAVARVHVSTSRVANQQMQYFNNLIAKKFAGDIQVYLSRLSREGDMLVREQEKLLTALMALSTEELQTKDSKAVETVREYHKEVQQFMHIFKDTVKQHVYAIQRVNNLCS